MMRWMVLVVEMRSKFGFPSNQCHCQLDSVDPFGCAFGCSFSVLEVDALHVR